MSYRNYLLKRILSVIPVFFGLSILIFFLARVVPGDPARQALGPRASEEAVEQLREDMGLNDPIWVQYGEYMTSLFQGEMGVALTTSRDVSADLAYYFPATLELVVVAMLIAILVGVPLGIISAKNKDQFEDNASRALSFVGVSMPQFWAAILLQLVFAFWLGLLPATGRIGDVGYTQVTGFLLFDSLITFNFAAFQSAAAHIFLPALTLSLAPMADITRMTRSSFIEEYNKEYVEGLRTHSIPEKLLVYKYVLKRSSTSTLTIAGLDFGFLIGGAFLVEIVFGWPGMARYGVDAILANDINAVVGVTLVIGIIYLLANLVVDILYGYLDPRVRVSGGRQ
ncbi:ABC transporter permease [Halovivax gelatinilyticus]|uniref:ABC transporter permease n=1 Tax=Halovivax gelatinilyticus TaxID=2961597 RepID=UPI0020CA3BC3|nr:ABC transporter permease [Halovivax gelatinilyticus]